MCGCVRVCVCVYVSMFQRNFKVLMLPGVLDFLFHIYIYIYIKKTEKCILNC